MAPLEFISFAGAFLISFHFSHAHSAAVVDCLEAINAPRVLAGLPSFVEKSVPLVAQDPESLCNRVQQETGGYDEKVTYFYAPQTGDEHDCAAAVSYWRGGLALVKNQLPPAYKSNTEIYKDDRLLGLVGMYNPNQNPTLECKYVTCTVTTTTTAAPTSGSPSPGVDSGSPGGSQRAARGTPRKGDGEPTEVQEGASAPSGGKTAAPSPLNAAAGAGTEASTVPPSTTDSAPEQNSEMDLGSSGRSRRLGVAEATHFNALVCITTPPVLVEDKEPFAQDQWTKIVGSMSASSTATVSAFSLLAVAGLALYVI